MKISILAFGIAKDIIGGTSLPLEVNEGLNVNELKELLGEKFPKFKELTSLMIAINNEYAMATDSIHATDEIALIPPVSGG